MKFNPHQWYLNGLKKQVIVGTNTYIGGIGSFITSASDLASLLLISVSDIHNFSIDGSNNISCYINVNYSIPINCFRNDGSAYNWGGGNILTYYNDAENKVTSINSAAFYSSTGSNLKYVIFNAATSIGYYAFRYCTKLEYGEFASCTSLLSGNSHFAFTLSLKYVYLPICTNYDADVGYNNVFEASKQGLKIYAEPTMETINGGGVEGDLAYVTSTLSGTVVYVDNLTAPNPITDLAVGSVSGTAIQLTFTPPSSTNTIDFYEVYVDGFYNNRINASGDYAVGLDLNTSYNIQVKAVDIYYNKGGSNTVTQTTGASLVFPIDYIVSYWQFENNVLDSVGSNNGTATAITYATGQVGNAAVFNGSTSYISISDDDNLSFGDGATDSQFSVSFLFKLNSIDATNGIWFLNKRGGTTDREWQILYFGGKLEFVLFDQSTGGTIRISHTVSLSLATQYYLTVTYNGGGLHTGIKMYLNNVSVGTTSLTGSYTAMENLNSNLVIGTRAWTIGTSTVDGQLDEPVIFNKELSAAEVSDIYATLNAGNHLI